MKILSIIKLLILMILLTNCCYAETGISSRKIIFVSNQPLSGPAKDFSYIGKSSKAYFQYVNDQGGVHGRSIVLNIFDDQFRPEKTFKILNELTVKNEIFAVFSGLGNENFKSILGLLKQQDIPSFFVGSDQAEWTQPVMKNVFSFLPNPEIEARVLGKYLTNNHSGSEMIIWYADNKKYLRSVKAITKELFGVSAKLLPGKKGRLKAEWNLISKRKPDLLVALGNYGDLMNFLKGYPNLDIPVYTGHALADSRITEWLGSSVYPSVRVLSAYPLIYEKENQGVSLHKKILNEYEPKLIPNRWTLYGHAIAELMVEILNRTGRSLNRERAISSAETLINWKGKLMPPVFIDSDNHLALTTFRVSQILPGKVNHFSDWLDGRENN